MTPTSQGSIKLFRFSGIDVFVHWSWFLIAVYQVQGRQGVYHSYVWNVYEYLFLFGIVLLHEFGHALACRQVGGQAHQIVLWPLGGVAYVSPPPRPGATLWSIAAGPLVNVVLMPVLLGLSYLAKKQGWEYSLPDIYQLIKTVLFINTGLLVFNLLPVYPLDGGQILRSLLWYKFGPGKSLLITTIIGFVGVAGLIALALYMRSIWSGIMCFFVAMSCWRGFQQARGLMAVERQPKHFGFQCPSCRAFPAAGEYWGCGSCRRAFDTFASQSFCPGCGTRFDLTQCLNCGNATPFREWMVTQPVPPPVRY